MERIILHVDMDAFFAQIEERENPHFRGKPIVVGADPKSGKSRGVVSTANYEARKYGIHSAMPISLAWRAYPGAIFLPVNMKLYEKVSESIINIIKGYSPYYEVTSLDEVYLDLSFLLPNDPLGRIIREIGYKKAEKLGQKLKRDIFKQQKLTCTVGIGPNKMLAKMATNRGKPNGLVVIKPEEVSEFLDDLDIEELPGIGPKTAKKLRESFNVNRMKDLKKLSTETLENEFGIIGKDFYEKARGINSDPVINDYPVKSIGEEHTFEKDTRDPELIFGTFEKIIKNVYEETSYDKFLFKTITIICRFSGFETHTKAKTFMQPIKDIKILESEAKKLLLRFLIENHKSVRLVGLRLSSFSEE